MKDVLSSKNNCDLITWKNFGSQHKTYMALRDKRTGTSGTRASIPWNFQASVLSRAAFSDQRRQSVKEMQVLAAGTGCTKS